MRACAGWTCLSGHAETWIFFNWKSISWIPIKKKSQYFPRYRYMLTIHWYTSSIRGGGMTTAHDCQTAINLLPSTLLPPVRIKFLWQRHLMGKIKNIIKGPCLIYYCSPIKHWRWHMYTDIHRHWNCHWQWLWHGHGYRYGHGIDKFKSNHRKNWPRLGFNKIQGHL
jgi:hypothetical protein